MHFLKESVVPSSGVGDGTGNHAKLLGVGEVAALVGAVAISVTVMFVLWEGVEQGFGHDDSVVHVFHFLRGVSTSLVTAAIVGFIAVHYARDRRDSLEREIVARTSALQESKHVFETVVEHIPAGLWILDPDFRVMFANNEAKRIHGHTVALGERYPCEVSKKGLDVVCKTCPAKHTLKKGEPARKKGLRTEPETGEIVSVETYPLELSEGTTCALIIEKVVTEQQKLQATLLHQEKMAAFGLLAAGIAHDMGNPLSGIEMHLQLMDDPGEEGFSEDSKESLVTVRREVARLRRILRDLVDFARRRRSEESLVSVHSVVEDALKLLRYDQRMHGVEARIKADPDAPAVQMVEDHLMQVCLNLMINALDAMPNGGTLTIEIKSVDDGVALRLHDTGTGMNRDVLDRCLEPLFSTKPVGRGTGLGLSTCKDVLEQAGGRIEFHSAPGKGTSALVHLPGISGAADSSSAAPDMVA